MTETPTTAITTLHCDMERDCREPVTHIDHKGWVYCQRHGRDRKASGIRCRRLKPAERTLLYAGHALQRY